MNNARVIASFQEEEDPVKIAAHRKRSRDAKQYAAQVISCLELVRTLKKDTNFKKFLRLIIKPAVEIAQGQIRNRKAPIEDHWYFCGHLDALEKYLDIENLESFYEREFQKAQIRSKSLTQENNDNGQKENN